MYTYRVGECLYMKKMIGLLIFLFAFYFGLQAFLVLIGKGHEIEYELKSDENIILINEKYNSNRKDEDNYILTINVDDVVFNYLTYQNFNKSSEIVKEVKYFKDEQLKCIFIKFRKDQILTDVLCNNGSFVIPYHNIPNPTPQLQQFVDTLSNDGYVLKNWIDDKEDVEAHLSLILYPNNRISNHNVAIAENKMLYKLYTDGSVTHKNIFTPSEEVVHGFVNNKYISYNTSNGTKSEYQVHSLTSSSKKEIIAKSNLGVQNVLGSYGNSIYIYDITNRIQYEVDIKSEKVLEVASAGSKVKYYESGKWQYVEPENYAISRNDFGTEYKNDYSNLEYFKVIKRGYDIGYYYGFKFVNGVYQVYRSISDDMSNPTYIFTTDNLDSIKFVGEYVYYMEENIIKHYSDVTGNRTLLYFDGLNKNSIYNVFIDEKK